MAGEPLTPWITLWKNDGTSTSNNWQIGVALPSAESLGWTRDGYSFVNWNTEADGSGTSYEVGVLAPSGVGNHYAQWAADSTDYIATSTDLTSVANAIRTKAGLSVTLEFPSDFVTAIANIPTGTTPTGTKQISITQNGTTTEDVTNYASAQIAVNVPTGITPTGTISITQNGTVDVTNYASANVSVSGGGVTAVEEKDVNFYDYDGTCVASYTASEFANLSALPANPTHSGLTAQGWNWTLSDAKTCVAANGWLHIGQMYVTNDGKTRLYITIPNDAPEAFRLFTVRYRQTVANDVTVDWGDNSTNTYSGTSAANHDHTYASGGHYVVTLSATSGDIYLDTNSNATICGSSSSATRYKSSYIDKIEIGNVKQIGESCFAQCKCCVSVTVPKITTEIGSGAFFGMSALQFVTLPPSTRTVGSFQYAYALLAVSIPKETTSFTTAAFSGCGCLRRVFIPTGVQAIPNQTLNNCSALQSVTIPATVTSMGAQIFTNNFATMEYHIKATTPPTLDNSNSFSGITSNCKIYVPSASLDTYKSATNWSSYASKMVGE